MEQRENYSDLILKLDAFIRKYYKNQLIRGGIYSFTLILAGYLSLTSLEAVGHFSITIRTILFYAFVTGLFFVLARFVFMPLSRLYRIGSIIPHRNQIQLL